MAGILPGGNQNNLIGYRFIGADAAKEAVSPISRTAQRKFSDRTHNKEEARIVFQKDGFDLPKCDIKIKSTQPCTLEEANKTSFWDRTFKRIFGHDRWIPLQVGVENGVPMYVKVDSASLQEQLFLNKDFEQSVPETQVQKKPGKPHQIWVKLNESSIGIFRSIASTLIVIKELYSKRLRKTKQLKALQNENVQAFIVKRLEQIAIKDKLDVVRVDIAQAKQIIAGGGKNQPNLSNWNTKTNPREFHLRKLALTEKVLNELIEKSPEEDTELRNELIRMKEELNILKLTITNQPI